MRRKLTAIYTLVALMALVLSAAPVARGDDTEDFEGKMDGFQQVPSVSTTGRGRFEADVARDGKSMKYTLRYSRLEGTPFAAHLHFAQRHVNGRVVLDLCGGSKPACPALDARGRARIDGTLTAKDIVLVPTTTPPTQSQGIDAQTDAEFAEIVRAMRAGAIYANLHTSKFPGGEIRGQVRED